MSNADGILSVIVLSNYSVIELLIWIYNLQFTCQKWLRGYGGAMTNATNHTHYQTSHMIESWTQIRWKPQDLPRVVLEYSQIEDIFGD
jgi:hypothetical protein